MFYTSYKRNYTVIPYTTNISYIYFVFVCELNIEFVTYKTSLIDDIKGSLRQNITKLKKKKFHILTAHDVTKHVLKLYV